MDKAERRAIFMRALAGAAGITLQDWQEDAARHLLDAPLGALVMPPLPRHAMVDMLRGINRMADHIPLVVMDLARPGADRTSTIVGRCIGFDPATGLARIKFGCRKSKGWRRHVRRQKARNAKR